ncbi:MAG: LysM peptidoglycan-binding domain-containing protein [Acidimicrobiales bacterium]
MNVFRSLGTPLLLAGAAAVLAATGDGSLAPPPVTSLDALAAWLDERDTATAALALVRLGALVSCTWLAAAGAVAAVARLRGWVRVAAAAERRLPASLRPVAAGLAGTSLVLTATTLDGAVSEAPAGDRLVLLPQEEPGGTATMTSLDDESPAAEEVVEAWTVEPGDSFWSIAESVLADAWGRAPTDAEIVPYWLELIDANRANLVSANPDLILPGQVFTVPPPPAAA